jgi:hypothetical protein
VNVRTFTFRFESRFYPALRLARESRSAQETLPTS